MARIVKGPIPQQVECDSCRATIEYSPEAVEKRHSFDYGGRLSGWTRVKCPRQGCPGHGYIDRW